MPDLGTFKGCAYAKIYYDPYKTDWVYSARFSAAQAESGRQRNSVNKKYCQTIIVTLYMQTTLVLNS